GKHFQRFHRAALRDEGMQTHGARNARLPGQRRIDRLNFVHQQCRLYASALADTLLRWLRWRRCSTHPANHATDHAAHRATSDATGNAAGHALADVWRIFLNDFDVFRDDLRLHEFAGVHQMDLRLNVHHLRLNWGWR